ncbi:MAG TPA: DUF58 domain-containing protein [Thiolinea sp.]|nr:DUF58 domain-containing protein [Thiolinea sp.]
MLLYLIGVNFRNTLVYAVCFWLLALWVVNILHTCFNLSGLVVTGLRVEPAFVGQKVMFRLRVSGPAGRRYRGIYLGWPGQDMVRVDRVRQEPVEVTLTMTATRRGRFQPPRIEVFSRYPTGLALAWTYVTLDIRGLVFPEPVQLTDARQVRSAAAREQDSGMAIRGGHSDFGGLRDYQPGDVPNRIHWAAYARSGQLQVREFVDFQTSAEWLDWDQLPVAGTEARLSVLCALVLEAHAKQHRFGLRLPGVCLEPAQGEAHRLRCLSALALFGQEAEDD